MGTIGTVYIGQVRETPVGDLWLACSERGLIAVEWGNSKAKLIQYLEKRLKARVEDNPRRLALAASELRGYLDGKRKKFGIQIDWSGMSAFQRQVLLATYAVPYGQTTTYGDLAYQLGRMRSARAVGRAEATNPMPIVIPCHRVLGIDGKLRGYGGGLEIKKWLLQMEGAVLA